METPQAHPRVIQGVCRRDLLKAGLALSVTLSPWPLQHPSGTLGSRSGATQARGHPPRARAWIRRTLTRI